MNSGFTSERVYGALKRRLLSGEFKPGDRLDPALLSETLSSSVTPVRDVLNILRGEGLVETRTGEGFFRPQVTAPDLEDLYLWNEQILLLSLRHKSLPVLEQVRGDLIAGLAESTATLFLQMAACSINLEYRRAVANANDRLAAVRTAEEHVLDGIASELSGFADAMVAVDSRDLARRVAAYHRRRRRVVSDIVRAAYRS